MNDTPKSKYSHKTFTGKNSIEKNVNAIIDEITRTKKVLDKNDIMFWSFRRFLLTIGFTDTYTHSKLRGAYFREDNEDFYNMIIGKNPVSLTGIKIRAKEFLFAVKEYYRLYVD